MALKIGRFIALFLAAVGCGLTGDVWSNWRTASGVAACAWLVILLVTTLQDTETKGAGR